MYDSGYGETAGEGREGVVVEAPPWYGEPTAVERLLSLVAGLPHERWSHDLMAMFTVYFDDSGSHRGPHRFVLAGYLATVNDWLGLTAEWQDFLRENKLCYFHMTDAEARQDRRPKPYDSWDDATRDANNTRLANIVKRYVVCGTAVELNRSEFDHAVRPLLGLADDIVGDHFNLLHQQSIYLVSEVCKQICIRNSDVDIVYSDQPRTAIPLQTCAVAAQACGFQIPTFRPMFKFPPLQAADMLAWTVYKHWGKDALDLYPRHEPLLENVRKKRIDANTLQAWAADLRSRLEISFGMTLDEFRELQRKADAVAQNKRGRP